MNNDIRETFRRFRNALNEAEEMNGTNENDQNGVFYSQQDELFQTTTQSAKQQFGAVFDNKDKCMIYYRDDGNVSVTGKIPSLNDIQFQYKYKSDNGNGCYIWTNGQMVLSEESLKILTKVFGVYKNWKQQLDGAEDLKPMNLKNEED